MDDDCSSASVESALALDKQFVIFYSNISSFSIIAQGFLFSGFAQKYHALAFVEHHKTNQEQIINTCSQHNRRAYVTEAETTSEHGSHGGEALAFQKHLNTMPIDQMILDEIHESTGSKLRMTAAYVRLKSFTLLLITVYLFCSEGFSERNNDIMAQINLLTKLTGLPFIILGDFNVIPEELLASGWLSHLGAKIRTSELPSSTTASTDRNIDMCVHSICLDHIFIYLKAVVGVPWGPHIGFELAIHARPRSVKGQVLSIPKPLPIDDFTEQWSRLNQFEQLQKWKQANHYAKQILHNQKLKTGSPF